MMNWLTKWRSRPQTSTRNYKAVQSGSFFSFGQINSSADQALRMALPTLRGRSRDLAINNPHISRYLDVLCTNVVGPDGFRLQTDIRNLPTKNHPEGTKDVRANQIIETAWAEWCKYGNPTTTGKMSFVDCLNVLVKGLARDGEVFVHLVRDPSSLHGFQLQFIEPELIDETKNQDKPNGTKIVMGIEMSDYNKPLAYHVRERSDDGYAGARKTRRISADDIIHIFMPNRPSQSRGEPWTAPVMHLISMLDAYDEAHVVAARMAANVSYAVTSSDPSVMADEFIDDQPVTFGEPGSVLRLCAGEDVKTLAASHPTQNAASMREGIIQAVAAGLGVDYASISQDLSKVNYSSTQFGAQGSRDYYASLHRFIISSFCQPVFERWLVMAMTVNAIELPLSKYKKFVTGSQFFPRTWHHNDPLKEMNAMSKGLESGILTIADIAKKQGRTFDEQIEELKRSKEALEENGISFAHMPSEQKESIDETELRVPE